ncbi:MAG: Single-stranded DNA-binding protein 1 [Rickettsiales bacterium]|nr:Single-stranded DNA-binding protein 1 [Rickettsiales bacterium]
MSFNYNNCTLMGRLTKDPDFKEINDSFCKLTFTLAISRKFRKEDGTIETDFIPVTLIGTPAIVGSKLLAKGSPVLIWGAIQVRQYDKDNERKWITEIIGDNFQLLEKRKRIEEKQKIEEKQIA